METNKSVNLYDFLRRIKSEVEHHGFHNKNFALTISEEEYSWLEQFLHAPDFEIHFKFRRTGQLINGQPVFEKNFAISGASVDVFSLLTEAMMANSSFASLVGAANHFFTQHVPNCFECSASLDVADPAKPNWTFRDHGKD